MDACQTCTFFLSSDDAQGLCRRFPPVPLIHVNGPVVSVFPPMLNEGRCGEFKSKNGVLQ